MLCMLTSSITWHALLLAELRLVGVSYQGFM